MINEYLTVKEISRKVNMTMRNVRKIVSKLKNEKSESLIHKDKNNNWLIHHLLLPNFKRKRNKKESYYAITIDPSGDYTEKEIDEVFNYVVDKIDQTDLEFHYSIEKKIKDGKNHIHCFTNSIERKKLITALHLGFSKMSYFQSVIFDLDGWKNYITKTGTAIKMIKKNNENGK
jgi:hypothetical protein